MLLSCNGSEDWEEEKTRGILLLQDNELAYIAQVDMAQENMRKKSGMVSRCILLLQDNEHAHTAQVDMVPEKMRKRMLRNVDSMHSPFIG